MKKSSFFILIFFIVNLLTAQVTSDFEGGDLDNWHSEGDGNSTWVSDMGNPNGCVKVEDDATGNMNYAYAPIKFLGDWTNATTNDSISVDIFVHNYGGGYVDPNWVFKLEGDGGSAIAHDSPYPTPSLDVWQTYSIHLDSTLWNIQSGNWTAILQNVNTLMITVEYIAGDEYVLMDNVKLSFTPTLNPLEPTICSDFEDGMLSGWSFLNTGSVSIPSSGGNPNRYIKINDGTGISLAVPSSKYHGDWSLLDNHNAEISIDLQISNFSGALLPFGNLIKISGPGGEATFPWDNTISEAFNKWHTFSVPIQESGWTILSGDWNSILNFVTNIEVAAEFINGSEVVGIDNFCITNNPPFCDFTATKTTVFLGDSVQFENLSMQANDWSWDFGDSNLSNEENPKHLYSSTGLYTVELTVSNYFGNDNKTKTNYIEVLAVDQCLKFEDDFEDASINEVWNFRNGSWQENGGVFIQTSNHWEDYSYLNGCFAIVGSPYWSEYIFSSKFKSTDNDVIGFVFNYQDENNMYMFRWNKQEQKRELSKFINGVETILANDEIIYNQGEWYDIDIYSLNGNIVISINDESVFDVIDNTFVSGKLAYYCWANSNSYWDDLKVECAGSPVAITAALEGCFVTSEMQTTLGDSSLISNDNPYTNSPWNYTGNESVKSFSNPDIVDWVLLDFRDATTAATALTSTSIEKRAALLLKDGSIISPYGSIPVYLKAEVTNNLFVVVTHRNHLSVMSANAVIKTGDTYTYDFTTAISQAYNSGQKLVDGKAVFFAGDLNADGNINEIDETFWETQAGQKGYLQSDANLDTQVDNKDKDDVWILNTGLSTEVPE